MGCGGRLGAENCLCWGCLKDACWWVRWACVGGEGRSRYKSADVCIANFVVGRKGAGFIVHF